MIGRIVSTKMNKTAVVLVTSTKTHPLYKKSYVRGKKFLAHNELGVNLGDMVEIIQVKPYSKKKNWKIQKVVGRQFAEVAKEHLKEAARAAIEEVMPASPDSLREASDDQGGSEEKELRIKNKELREEKQLKKEENSEKKVVVDDSIVKPESKKKGKTESSK